MSDVIDIKRRRLIQASLGAAGAGFGGALLSFEALAADKVTVNMQLGWVPGGNQIGEVTAKHMGFYEQEGIDFKIQPGGLNTDGVAVIASGRFELGQISSSSSVMLAVSQGTPIKCFAVGLQQHPYAFFSLKKNPIRTPKDMVGKKIGVQSSGLVLLRALLAKNNIAEKDVQVVQIGAEIAPLVTGQVDAITGWQTNTTVLKALGPDRVDLRLWDAGVRLYALPYYATAKTIQTRPDLLERFLRATARGYLYANTNRDKAIDLLMKEFPNLNRADEREAVNMFMFFAFNQTFNQTSQNPGWGAMDPVVWREQIDLYARLGQFTNHTPKPEDVFTLDILKTTLAARLKA